MNDKLAVLGEIWERVSSSSFEIIKPGLKVFHSGHIPSMHEMEDELALWTTREEIKKYDYSGLAKSAKNPKHPATLLTLEIRLQLRAANFASVSLMPFAIGYCESNHDQLKMAIRDWCIQNEFDAVVSLNCNPSEVLIVRPKSSLSLLHAQQL